MMLHSWQRTAHRQKVPLATEQQWQGVRARDCVAQCFFSHDIVYIYR